MTSPNTNAPGTPIVLVSACALTDDQGRTMHRVNDKYVDALVECADVSPLILPALGSALDLDAILARVDGVVLTGSPSNVMPDQYGGPAFADTIERDPQRDATTLPLIQRTIACGIPLLAICRGIQEMNVALGGTLTQAVQDIPGKRDHRMDRSLSYDGRYGPAHPIEVQAGGYLHKILGGAKEVMVNSLHAQAIAEPADGLFIEAVSDDGIIEAVSVPDAAAFALAVQWHPEHAVARNIEINLGIYKAFGSAVRQRLTARGEDVSAAYR